MEDQVVLSKNQLKKIKKQERLKILKIEMRSKVREKKKEKKKAQKEELDNKLNGLNEDERKQFFDEMKRKELSIEDNLKKGLSSPFKIIFDLDYTQFMQTKEIKSLAHQISISYSLNKKSPNPICFHICGYKDLIKEELEKMGSKNWHVNKYEKFFYEEEFFNDKKFVYLSPEAEKVLDEVNPEDILIIGGYVDKPIDKFKSFQKAQSLNIETKRLPLRNNIKNKSNALNINTVCEIISYFIEFKDWDKAFDLSIPKRLLMENEIK